MDDPAAFVLSGHREMMGKVKGPLVDVDEALIGFGETARTASRRYMAAIRAALEEDLSDHRPLGIASPSSEDQELEPEASVYNDALGRSTGIERPRLDTGHYLQAVSAILDLEIERLTSQRRDSETARLRQLVAALGVERWGQRAGHLARALDKHPVAVSRWVADAGPCRATRLRRNRPPGGARGP